MLVWNTGMGVEVVSKSECLTIVYLTAVRLVVLRSRSRSSSISISSSGNR
jgi:hypothetical protein